MTSRPCPRYSIVIPTFRRPDMLSGCLEALCAADYPLRAFEVIVIDNGGAAENSAPSAERFRNRLAITYLINRVNRGYGYSVNRGLASANGDVLMILNDDARPAPDLFRRCDELLASDPSIGCVGCRAIEAGYVRTGDGIGRLTATGQVVGNFDVDCEGPIDVEHVYGFCYLFTREALHLGGLNDRTLLARPYSSGNRIETDHCLTVLEKGLRVVYAPALTAVHLAKPRPDMSEVSLRWKRNAVRNTIYLFLKHFGPFGRGGAALRLTFADDVGLLSLLKRPTGSNLRYFVHGLGSRASAYWHWLLFLVGWTSDDPDALRRALAVSEDPPLWQPSREITTDGAAC